MKTILKSKQEIIYLSNFQKEKIKQVKEKIKQWKYRLVKNKCLCANDLEGKDVVISSKDRYWFDIEQLLCSKCWLIRSGQIFDNKSNQQFYEKEYRDIYVGEIENIDSFFKEQTIRGNSFLELFKKFQSKNNLSVFEIWCGAGWILYPRFKEWFPVHWVDFNKEYLQYGKAKWLNLDYWDYNDILDDNSADVIILSHVLEHLINPIEELQNIVSKIKQWGYLIIEVPGIFYIDKMYFNPLLYFQNAHVFNYYYYYLKIMFQTLWLEVLHWDERCTFILQKPNNYKKNNIKTIYHESFSIYPNKIKTYLVRCKKFLYLNPYFIANKILTPLGLYPFFRNLYFKVLKNIWK